MKFRLNSLDIPKIPADFPPVAMICTTPLNSFLFNKSKLRTTRKQNHKQKPHGLGHELNVKCPVMDRLLPKSSFVLFMFLFFLVVFRFASTMQYMVNSIHWIRKYEYEHSCIILCIIWIHSIWFCAGQKSLYLSSLFNYFYLYSTFFTFECLLRCRWNQMTWRQYKISTLKYFPG